MRTFSRNSTIGQYLNSFWMPFADHCSNICHVFWLALLKTLILAAVTALGAITISPVVASIFVFFATGYIAVPLGVFLFFSGLIGALATIFYSICWIGELLSKGKAKEIKDATLDKITNNSVVDAVGDYYESHKEKYCISVTFKDE